MIEIKLEDFENYRSALTKYAFNLLRVRGWGGYRRGEIDEAAKDIVQNAYLRFQTSDLNVFVSLDHFNSFLKLCLYRSYQDELDYRCKNLNWLLFCSRFEDGLMDKALVARVEKPTVEQFDIIDKFKDKLNDNQKIIVQKLLDGYSQADIAKEKNISRQAISDSLSYIRKIYEGKNM